MTREEIAARLGAGDYVADRHVATALLLMEVPATGAAVAHWPRPVASLRAAAGGAASAVIMVAGAAVATAWPKPKPAQYIMYQ